jgi:dipeptidyl aminopeptidase/acylaminoacyl peptidase
MTEKTIRPFGLWPSPIQPAVLAQSLRLSDVAWDSDGETLVWLEGRSDRGVLVCAPPEQAPRDLTETLSVRAMVGYGGGDLGVGRGYAYFVAQEGRLYRQSLTGGQAQSITPQFGHMASPVPSPDGKWVVFVHTYEGVDGLAIVDAEGKAWPQKLAYGDDFYMQPCWHPDGTRLAWVSWTHPHMPWDSTMLKVATLGLTTHTDGEGLPIAVEVNTLVDKPDVAIFQPQFSPDGRALAYISDESGWGNLYLYDLETNAHRLLTSDPVEVARPAWAQGLRTYGFSPDGQRIYYLRNEAGFIRLWEVTCVGTMPGAGDAATEKARPVSGPLSSYTELAQIAVAPRRGSLAFIASSSTVSPRVISAVPGGDAPVHIHRRSSGESIRQADLSTPRPVHWTVAKAHAVASTAQDPSGTGDGMAVGLTAHGLYYPPASSQFSGQGLPPAVINIHGGPTGQSTAGYNARAQFFATRGYAYLEVNYRGSTGYGKPYMAALRGQWGILDVEDAIGGARYLVDARLADPERLVIMGGSAGGYTVLKTLVDHPGFFKAAICLYGVSNMFTLAADTHKFEERYLDSMLGPLPQASRMYRDRSPIFNAERIVDPIAIFQGEIDRVVPKAQSEAIVASLRQRGVAHEYHLYEGEGHGWRKRETIEQFYQAVDSFLKRHVIFA